MAARTIALQPRRTTGPSGASVRGESHDASSPSDSAGSPVSVSHTWREIEALLQASGALELLALAPPAAPAAIEALERHVGRSLPAPLKALLSLHDGQRESAPEGLFFGLRLLSVHGIRTHWDNWKTLEDLNEDFAGAMSSRPPGVIKPLYANPGWIPFTDDGGGNHTAIDLDPDANGRVGQVITFGGDEDEKKLLGRSLEEFLARFLVQLQTISWSMADGRWSFDDPRYRKHYHEWALLGEGASPQVS